MDTSDLPSSLSLAGFLLLFAYLSLVEVSSSPRSARARSPEQLSRLVFTLRILRLASVVAIVLSGQALFVSQWSSGPAMMALAALALLALMVTIDRAANLLSSRYPGASAKLASLVQSPIFSLLHPKRRGEPVIGDRLEVNNQDHIANGSEAIEETTVVITEEEQAGLDARERLMIRSILRLDDSMVREIMVPRVDILAVDSSVSITEVARLMLESGHSRLPVYGESIDNIIGVVYSRDLLPFLGKVDQYPSLEKVVRPAFFIPESKRLDELLKELQEKRIQMAMVVDEYGGIEGLVTLEDLLEEIVGEIEDEFSRSLEPRVVPFASGEIIVDGRVTLDDLSTLLSTPLGNEDVDTLGGLVYSSLGKMPKVGDEVVYNGLRIEVVSLLGRRIRKLKLTRTETQ